MRWSQRLLPLLLWVGGLGCSVNDPVAVLPAPSQDVCERASRAARVFQYALCTCESLTASAQLVTDSFQSSLGPWAPGGTSAPVATNGDLTANDSVQVGGSLWVGGTGAGLQLVARPLVVSGTLRSAGPLRGPLASVQVEDDAFIAGHVNLARLKVGGALTVPADRDLEVSVPLEVAGEVLREPVAAFAPRCPCDTSELDDITSAVSSHATDNDNASLSLEPEALSGFNGDRTLRLEEGSFYLRGITGSGTALLVVQGKAALFVEGDVRVEGLTVSLEEAAELDLFIAGSLSARQRLGLDSPRFPSRLRVYVSGAQLLQAPTVGTVVGSFAAPRTAMELGTGVEFFGAVLAQRVNAGSELSIHYDSDVQGLAEACSTANDGRVFSR